jgi:two-component system phosphate regulon sensor histidine kinase PhoR
VSGRRVLVVDDEKDYLKLMAGHLTRKGFEVEMAENGRVALEVLESGDPFEVMVVDLMMPEVDGIELIRRAREIDAWMESIVVSGAGTLESAISSMRQGGAFDYLPKPLETMNDLSLAVDRAASYRQLRLDRERLQDQIAAERERLETVIANAGEAVISTDGEGRISVVNSTAAELFGPDDLAGKQALDVLPPALASVVQNWISFGRQAPTITEVRWPANVVHMVSLTPIQDSAPKAAVGWVMILRDVSPLRRMQEQKMRLLARTADQLRTPLAEAFSAVVQLNELPENSDERFTGIIEQQVDRLSAIRSWTDDMLALLEIEAGEAGGEGVATLAELVQSEAGRLKEGLVGAKELDLDVRLDEGVDMKVDDVMGRSLVSHMVRQAAWRAVPKGKVTLYLTRRDGQCWLEVTDDGPRLREQEGTELFESFAFKAGDLGEGAGMSLATVKTIADVLGGHVWLASLDPQGNRLSVSFTCSNI